jgi:2',3'-cyclic-nucleotide 2'-phosphodiesterase (5'-nucleotidase family)
VPVVTPRVVLDVGNGIKVGVTAVLGEQAYNDVPVDFRGNQRYVDYVEAAVAQAAALRKSGCHVIVCLSHTGLNRGDAELVATGAFDVVFGGHEHLYTPCAELPQSCGPSKRLGLYSQGMANGTGLAQVRLSVDPAAGGNITSHEGLLEALDGKLPLVPVAQEGVSVVGAALVQMSKVVGEWRDRFTAMAAEVVGHSAINVK